MRRENFDQRYKKEGERYEYRYPDHLWKENLAGGAGINPDASGHANSSACASS
jgi:hypothetical protein